MSERAVAGGGSRIGCDVVMVADVERSMDSFGERYLRRTFTEREVAESAGPTRGRRLAARFAAKEAVMKVLRPVDDAVPWTSIEVRRASWGGCEIELTGAAARLAAREMLGEIQISMSHEGEIAFATAIATVRDVTNTVSRGEKWA